MKPSFFTSQDLVHHPIETTIKRWMFQVPGERNIFSLYKPIRISMVRVMAPRGSMLTSQELRAPIEDGSAGHSALASKTLMICMASGPQNP